MSALYSCLKGKNDAIMAANTSEGAQTVMPEEPHEECSGKKKSKFQAFKKLFVKKKRKESTTPIKESNLKPSQSSSDVSGSGANTTAFDAEQESGSKGNMGSKAVSHDSVFISEMESPVKEDISQECTTGKVKALQLQLQQNIRIGSPPQGIVPKKLEDSGTLSEDDGLPRSPPEITSLHDILAHSSGKSPISAQRRNSISLGGTDSEDEPESSELSSRPTSPSHSNVLLCPTSPVSHFPLADFTSPASSVSCLDNSAAKHKILVKPKKRRPPIMNVKPTQGTNRTNKPEQMKKGEENDNMVEEQLFEIPDLDKCSVREGSSEDVKITEDVLQKLEEDMVASVCEPQIDVSELNSKKDNTPLILEVPLLENQIVSFQNEVVCSDTDVDFNESLISTGDRVDIAEEELERDEVPTSPQTCEFQPTHENNEITITVIPSEISSGETPEGSTVQIENPNLSTSQDLVCESLGNYEPNLEEAKDEEYKELGAVLPDIKNDLLNVSESDLIETETLENRMLSIQTVTSIKKDDDVQEVQVACECDRSHESNEKLLDTVEIKNTEAILKVSNQLVANNEGKNEHLPSEEKTETSGLSIAEVKDDQSDVDNVPDSKAPVLTNANDSSSTKVTTNAHDVGNFANSETSSEIAKEVKSAEPIPDSNIKGSNKPIRFTVAPAWQRALSSGSSVKDSPFIKNAAGNLVRSGSLDSADESVVQSSSKKMNVQKDQEESCGHFGVRLRRTSSSIKYNEDHQEDVSTEDLSPVDSSSLHLGKSLQTPKRTPFNVDCAKMSKTTSNDEEKVTPEVRSQPKPKADHSAPENTEPAWITMAKLKQKGFQEHPLAREQSSATEKNEKVKETECIQKKNIVTSSQVVEEKRSEQAAADSPAAPEVAQPDSEKSTPSTQPQNPEEPPWFVLAKKKAKAWSEKPEIVQQ